MLAIFLGGLSWGFSFLVDRSYEFTTWQCLVSLILIDIIFMYLFQSSRVHYIKSRWVCSILFISIVFTAIFSVLMYSYQYYIVSLDFLPLAVFRDYYQAFTFIMSALIMLVSATPQRIVSSLDGLYWPRFADNIRYTCDMDRRKDTKGGAH